MRQKSRRHKLARWPALVLKLYPCPKRRYIEPPLLIVALSTTHVGWRGTAWVCRPHRQRRGEIRYWRLLPTWLSQQRACPRSFLSPCSGTRKLSISLLPIRFTLSIPGRKCGRSDRCNQGDGCECYLHGAALLSRNGRQSTPRWPSNRGARVTTATKLPKDLSKLGLYVGGGRKVGERVLHETAARMSLWLWWKVPIVYFSHRNVTCLVLRRGFAWHYERIILPLSCSQAPVP